MAQNRATIYSNGIADFQRVFSVKSGVVKTISIPVRQNHLGDVLGSLTIAGNVSVDAPPSFQPANEDDSNVTIPGKNALVGLARQLTGADVEIRSEGQVYSGKIVGIQEQAVGTEGEPIQVSNFVVMIDGDLRRFSVNDVQGLKFAEEEIRAEIEKAMSRALREIKPNSTFVDLQLSTEEPETEAIIQYTIPAAAWKISYRIILQDDSPLLFHGHAIVDNNTDEDWKDMLIAVVVGQPITFSTDLADTKIPFREHVDVVQDSALGAVEVERAVMMESPDDSRRFLSDDHDPESLGMRQKSRHIGGRGGMASAQKMVAPAMVEEAEVEQAGDFCIFRSPSAVTIDAHKSSVIPVFQSVLDESKLVLHYKRANHAKRPFRSVKFRNSTGHPLGRGVCTIYDNDTFGGTCIIPAMKPDEDALLPHALEMGVRVLWDQGKVRMERTGLQVSDGVAVEISRQKVETEYRINNSGDLAYPFVLDHACVLPGKALEGYLVRDSQEEKLEMIVLENDRRIEFELQPKDVVKIRVVENAISRNKMKLVGNKPEDGIHRIGWLYKNFVESNSSFANEPLIQLAMERQQTLEKLRLEISNAEKEIERLSFRQERLRKNIESGGGQNQTLKWQTDLGAAEDAIVKLEDETLPELERKSEDARRDVFDALNELTLDWNKD